MRDTETLEQLHEAHLEKRSGGQIIARRIFEVR